MLNWAVAGEDDRPGQAMALMPLLAFWVAYYRAVVPGLAALARESRLSQRPLLMAMAVVSLALGYPLVSFLGLTAAFAPAILFLAAAVPGHLYVPERAA
jgi:fatty acid desaturase